MKKMKKILSFVFAITIVLMISTTSVFANWADATGCNYSIDYFCSHGSKLTRKLEVSLVDRVSGTGVGYNAYTSYTFKTPVSVSAYCTDCDLFGWDPGTGWMGNPGYATAYVDITGYECVGAYVEYYYYEDNVLCACKALRWSNTSPYINEYQ